MIILEGADGTGKSTAAEELASRLHLKVVHSPGYIENFFIASLNYHMMFPSEVIVYDRFYYSELVYGPIIRGESRVPDWFRFYIDNMLSKVKPLIIWCDVPNRVARENIKVHDQMKGVDEHLDDILSSYRALAHGDIMRHPMVHDYTRKSLDVTAISSWVSRRRTGLGI